MDLPASPETTTLEHSQSTSTPTVSAPRSRINDLLVSPLTADPTIDISTGWEQCSFGKLARRCK